MLGSIKHTLSKTLVYMYMSTPTQLQNYQIQCFHRKCYPAHISHAILLCPDAKSTHYISSYKKKIMHGLPWKTILLSLVVRFVDDITIFTRDCVIREHHWRIAPIVTKISLFMVNLISFHIYVYIFMYIYMYIQIVIRISPDDNWILTFYIGLHIFFVS